ncbi:uncharacterized protein BO95DRAFT_371900 [Aspergillus brunneoviolaceus CBS 621.78]|uniref:Rhodopsin domain-containing protein n=2 Tax=Aspergillus TaxID=5052 RepID=A0A8G1VZN5_9EURO|nr:hypothetical protein BO95DRAFT_371900 [Aspergillus brunneoviolaceus CBS 621.78]XP_040802492.1 uncharacterized protein BO72DRAFT_467757 [Aspergillus fijiensis CBS 313.89]RAH41953.1 hypothetical protein BO95DRAFT_371900 [Aspergillus brunneoviolaceus CBS 621.78]RAK78482.1 hypothetical protein BO72DRAFT_467757 [Aspergillus fijiensis CBS 313.89]
MSDLVGLPPKGTDLTANNESKNDAIVATMYTLACITISVRLFSRIKVQQARIGLDDWLIVAALLSGTANMISAVVGGKYGVGKHIWVVNMDDIVAMVKVLFANVLLYVTTVTLIKLSIILSYRRIFGMRWTMWACIVLALSYWVGCTIAFLAACQPVSYYWTKYLDPEGGRERYNLYAFYIGHAVANMVGDIVILLVPVPLVWRLQLRRSQKIQILSIFLLGGFVCVASAIRIYYFTFVNSVDVTWILGDVFIWSSIEPSIGIFCACLPVLQPLFRTILNRMLGTPAPVKPKPRSTGPPKAVRYAPNILSKIQGGDERIARRDEEAMLTTTSAHLELDSIGKGRHSDEEAGPMDLLSITIQKEFHVREEHR